MTQVEVAEKVIEIVKFIRSTKEQQGIPWNKLADAVIKANTDEVAAVVIAEMDTIKHMAGVRNLTLVHPYVKDVLELTPPA